jgi:hypothetical protein
MAEDPFPARGTSQMKQEKKKHNGANETQRSGNPIVPASKKPQQDSKNKVCKIEKKCFISKAHESPVTSPIAKALASHSFTPIRRRICCISPV